MSSLDLDEAEIASGTEIVPKAENRFDSTARQQVDYLQPTPAIICQIRGGRKSSLAKRLRSWWSRISSDLTGETTREQLTMTIEIPLRMLKLTAARQWCFLGEVLHQREFSKAVPTSAITA